MTTEILNDDRALALILRARGRELIKKQETIVNQARALRLDLERLDRELARLSSELQWVNTGIRSIEKTPMLDDVDYGI